MGIYRLIQTRIYFIRLEALKTPTSETPDFGGRASIPLAQQTPWGLTGRAWLRAGAQWVVKVVLPFCRNICGNA